ncbi:uncharacterized protein MONOS_14014 [Monocercomonoides exilis]|uniref:uncharacterized protein n=1 Tax=Monocercomonoides exilis TaxID=2049356 RepID=UPI0035594D5A|nr:hypothetical protein MONOS_14014 [Monocercomonoides exilis]|eukprot:MONOS_14014.1-p1 / transcript=MONOS_14014.1 / gene=MONOS_14014 / organism=Monocercomonoides_exilis_PA203 / gene_product=unspecified product / transcript_product=unspecified product / location=Mono_scaffold00921:11447-12201(+) / protein_length=194 / sequence_SO=supercontig / SO=protein_coding / is_pseudo=false
MQNATLVAGIAADGFSLPSVVLWPSATLPKELTTLLTPSLDIWPNTNDWMNKTAYKKFPLMPLYRGVSTVLKSELSNNYSSPSSTSSSSKRTTVADLFPYALHTAFTPSVIKKAFINSGVLSNGSGSVLMKLPQSSQYFIPSYPHCFDFFGKETTKENLLDEWDEYNEKHKMKIEEIEEKEKEIEKEQLPLEK